MFIFPLSYFHKFRDEFASIKSISCYFRVLPMDAQYFRFLPMDVQFRWSYELEDAIERRQYLPQKCILELLLFAAFLCDGNGKHNIPHFDKKMVRFKKYLSSRR